MQFSDFPDDLLEYIMLTCMTVSWFGTELALTNRRMFRILQNMNQSEVLRRIRARPYVITCRRDFRCYTKDLLNCEENILSYVAKLIQQGSLCRLDIVIGDHSFERLTYRPQWTPCTDEQCESLLSKFPVHKILMTI